MLTKICTVCKIEKPHSEYGVGKDSYGLYSCCKPCKSLKSQRIYRSRDPLTRWVLIAESEAKRRAVRKMIPFDLTRDLIREKFTLQEGKCVYCDIKMNLNGTRTNRRSSPTLDRLIPHEGYVTANVKICCFRCNAIKQDASPVELQQISNRLFSFLPK